MCRNTQDRGNSQMEKEATHNAYSECTCVNTSTGNTHLLLRKAREWLCCGRVGNCWGMRGSGHKEHPNINTELHLQRPSLLHLPKTRQQSHPALLCGADTPESSQPPILPQTLPHFSASLNGEILHGAHFLLFATPSQHLILRKIQSYRNFERIL